jgi:hypothetical protein
MQAPTTCKRPKQNKGTVSGLDLDQYKEIEKNITFASKLSSN